MAGRRRWRGGPRRRGDVEQRELGVRIVVDDHLAGPPSGHGCRRRNGSDRADDGRRFGPRDSVRQVERDGRGVQVIRAAVRDVDLENEIRDARIGGDDQLPRHQDVALFAFAEGFDAPHGGGAGSELHSGRRDPERHLDRLVPFAQDDGARALFATHVSLALAGEAQRIREVEESDDRRRVVHA